MSHRERIAYATVRALLRVALLLLTRASVRGREHLPRLGAGIVVSNQIAGVDPAVLVAVLPRPIAPMSKVENARGVLWSEDVLNHLEWIKDSLVREGFHVGHPEAKHRTRTR
ncbi:MAG TPA: hypothetical protein VKE41_16240 [Roseiflexaceae bacterium]|nr:hypothetical protein [Roseiflexaceae bacterium]